MEIDSNKSSEIEDNPLSPLPPHFDATMISGAQQVEPLHVSGNRSWRPRPLQNFLRGRLGVLIAIVIILLLGAAALGLFLGLRDRQNSADAATTNQLIPEPTNADAAPPVKAPPVKASVPAQPAETRVSDAKPIAPPTRIRRPMRDRPDDFDQTLAEIRRQTVARKVGEIYPSGRHGDRRGRKGESRRRERDDNDHD